MSEKYQNCIITLDDGTEHVFTGKAFCEPGDRKFIRDIQFTAPKPLPPMYSFEEIPKVERIKP